MSPSGVTSRSRTGRICGWCRRARPARSAAKPLKVQRAIEVGHVFKLGTKYSEALNALFLDETGKQQPAIMGCYGIGVTRTLQAVIEQSHDDNGIVWPISVAPLHGVHHPAERRARERRDAAR